MGQLKVWVLVWGQIKELDEARTTVPRRGRCRVPGCRFWNEDWSRTGWHRGSAPHRWSPGSSTRWPRLAATADPRHYGIFKRKFTNFKYEKAIFVGFRSGSDRHLFLLSFLAGQLFRFPSSVKARNDPEDQKKKTNDSRSDTIVSQPSRRSFQCNQVRHYSKTHWADVTIQYSL